MKKLIFTLLILIMTVSPVFAAGSVVVSSDLVKRVEGEPVIRIMALTCTADAAAATFPDKSLDPTSDSNIRGSLVGWRLSRVSIVGNHAGTEPKEDCDARIYLKVGTVTKAIDLLDGNGVDAIDNTVNNSVYPMIDGVAASQSITNTVTVDVDSAGENDVNSGVAYIELLFKK